jgi:hypothetical protein
MRGFPPIQIFLLCLAFVVLAVPLSHLTGNTSNAKIVKPETAESKSVKALLRLRYGDKPATLSLKVAGKELTTAIETSPIEIETSLPSTKDGFDVFLSATWPDGKPDNALTLDIEPDGLESHTETRWSSGGSLDEVITFTWK